MVADIEIRPEEAGEYFRGLLNKGLREGDYRRPQGYLRPTDKLDSLEMAYLSDIIEVDAVFNNYRGNHWNYVVDMGQSMTLVYDPIEGLVQEPTSVFDERNIVRYFGNSGIETDNLNNRNPLENHILEEVITYLKGLGTIQNNKYDCGPLCLYAAIGG